MGAARLVAVVTTRLQQLLLQKNDIEVFKRAFFLLPSESLFVCLLGLRTLIEDDRVHSKQWLSVITHMSSPVFAYICLHQYSHNGASRIGSLTIKAINVL